MHDCLVPLKKEVLRCFGEDPTLRPSWDAGELDGSRFPSNSKRKGFWWITLDNQQAAVSMERWPPLIIKCGSISIWVDLFLRDTRDAEPLPQLYQDSPGDKQSPLSYMHTFGPFHTCHVYLILTVISFLRPINMKIKIQDWLFLTRTWWTGGGFKRRWSFELPNIHAKIRSACRWSSCSNMPCWVR